MDVIAPTENWDFKNCMNLFFSSFHSTDTAFIARSTSSDIFNTVAESVENNLEVRSQFGVLGQASKGLS